MKSRIAIAVAAVLWAGTASANTNINLDGIAFHPSQNSTTTCASYGTTDVTNSCNTGLNTTFSLGLPFVPTGTSTMTIYADGWNPSGGTVLCNAYSYNYDNTFLGSSSFTYTTAGKFDQPLTLSSAALSTWAYVSVTCNIPYTAVLFGVAAHF